ncbi:MAG: TlpA disulfide reductase family protein, partial [Actinocatenispora sp.]
APTGPAHGAGMPDVAVPCFTGGRQVRLDRAYGRPTIVNLWASWCQPCRRELPEIARYAKTHPDVLVLTVDTGDRRSAGESFARAAGVRLPTLFDEDRRVLGGVGRSALPATVLVDADGTVAYTYNSTALTARTLDSLVHRHLPGAR